jgi:uncharacterized coiled-coil protein SlyX
MIFDELDFSQLSVNREEAFTEFVKTISAEYNDRVQNDRRTYSDQNGNYEGSYEPERSFVTAILAFLDEYGVESEIADISELSNDDFASHFGKFKSKVEYMTTRFKLRQSRIASGSIGTLITIGSDYKSEIGKLLDTARKIVNQEVTDTNKKDNIMAKIANLQSEVDRDQTTIDALFGRMLDLSQTVGQSAENLNPLLENLERVKKLFWDTSKKVEQLPKPDRPKLITKDKKKESDMDDEIPF